MAVYCLSCGNGNVMWLCRRRFLFLENGNKCGHEVYTQLFITWQDGTVYACV